ncbi:phospho-N-acetylmuramoyl-pentapeptide-transferase [Ectobacillus ponti]|uniref:Phospho-N-acetylmuramoyl-pentapeptide-transferase n=1 Tax=Ectobacillus ponti TaxID=2961894 RepID=A0AA41X7I8_9BACI|nr:phospho-N-acetylmuramoyl-pentapeptide-transferase [Ectobacillus ponti]MCP8968628.1 phospho-N-acetylmuramoyl-pentapeptide-transferase [Ectobacillus ponti]
MSITMQTLLFSFATVSLLTPVLIRFLKAYNLTQPIRAELPPDHQAKKGTPLMTGLIFLVSVLIACLLVKTSTVYFLGVIFVMFGAIGFLDDFKKAYFQDPQGASGRMKLVLQFLAAGTVLFLLLQMNMLSPEIRLLGPYSWELPHYIYIGLVLLFVVGSANAINFTDGLDGLLSVISIPTFFFFFLISDHIEVKVFCFAMIGGLLAFLIYNAYPAKAFMGDTGSLAIGGILSFLVVIEHVEVLAPLLFFIYFAEQLSVILQVAFFKMTGRRIFRMSPIHYHYALKYGWSENQIVVRFGFVAWAGTLVSWLYWYYYL